MSREILLPGSNSHCTVPRIFLLYQGKLKFVTLSHVLALSSTCGSELANLSFAHTVLMNLPYMSLEGRKGAGSIVTLLTFIWSLTSMCSHYAFLAYCSKSICNHTVGIGKAYTSHEQHVHDF